MCTNTLLEEPNSLSPLFIRRTDIDESTRIKIGFLLNYYPHWGLATALSKRYKVSRPFVYDQKKRVKSALSILEKSEQDSSHLTWEENLKWLLDYRIRGGISLSKCSDFLSSANFANSSIGWISETIKSTGDLVGDSFNSWEGEAFWASDEIYLIDGHCVLVNCDPVSMTIFSLRLCNQLNSESWKAEWSNLNASGVHSLGIVGDEGPSLLGAHSQLDSVGYQVDTFHAITQRLGKVLARLERQSLKSITHEYERELVYLNTKTVEQHLKKKKLYQQAVTNTEKALSLLSGFKWLYGQISRQLKVVRSNGEVRTKQFANDQVQAALDLMEECLDLDLSKEIKAIRKLLPDLFQYLDKAQDVHRLLAKQIDSHILPFHLAYWQYQKERINLKKAADKHRLTKSRRWLIQIIEEYQKQYPEQFKKEQQMVVLAMQQVIQSSAIVECINSILRPIFNESKGQISQQTLNLVRYWHNRRVFKRGVRKGKSPLELLTGEKNPEWKQEIVDLVKQTKAQKKAA